MSKAIYIDGNDLYLSKRYLKSFITIKAIEKWNSIKEVVRIEHENELFFLYKSIPFRTRKKLLPADKIISADAKGSSQSKVKELLHEAFYYKFSSYRSLYETESSFTSEQITKFAKLHSVFQSIIDLKKNEGYRDLITLQSEFNELFPGKYKTKQAFSQAVLKASVDGVMSVAMDKRTFGNNNRDRKQVTPQIDYVITALVSCNGKFTNAEMLERANAFFKEKGYGQFSLSWMKKQRREWLKNAVVYQARYGANELEKKLPYASMRSASYVHTQWQVDGWNLPFWEKGERGLVRSVLVYVIDNCSKKITGYAVGHTENGEVIKAAIRKAVDSTGVFPFEVVMDNHSFTKTKEAFNFERHLNTVGAILTKTSNPKHKAIIERYNQNIDALCRPFYGYLGKGIRSKSIEDISSDELRTDYAKNFLSHSEVIGIATIVIAEYNSKVQRILGKSPAQYFDENPHPSPITLNQFQRAKLLPNEKTKQVRNGQITISDGAVKFEYQLPAALWQRYNDETVLITYDELNDGVFALIVIQSSLLQCCI